MTSSLLFREDAYLGRTPATVVSAGPDGILLDRTVFYATGGGQPGDSGTIDWVGGSLAVTEAVKGAEPDLVLHRAAEGTPLPGPGTPVEAVLDWERRYRHMRMHTCMHLLCAVVPGDVTGGQVGAERSRLDFAVPSESLDREQIESQLNALIERALPTGTVWITDEEMLDRPELVRTMSVKPPMGAGRVRLLRIGPADAPVDLQPCGGTHVRNTAEIGRVTVAKIENKGRQNRRVVLAFA